MIGFHNDINSHHERAEDNSGGGGVTSNENDQSGIMIATPTTTTATNSQPLLQYNNINSEKTFHQLDQPGHLYNHHHAYHPYVYPTRPLVETMTQSHSMPNLSTRQQRNNFQYIRHNSATGGQFAVNLRFANDLNTMTQNWTLAEHESRRRLVRFEFEQNQQDGMKTIYFEPITPDQVESSKPIISCILWQERNRYIATSVDIILILEYLVAQSFGIEEKNRIRRNLQSLKPITVSRSNVCDCDFFNLIMSMENPRPRNIEKDLKVFNWGDLGKAIAKVMSKYSVIFNHPPPNTSSLSSNQKQNWENSGGGVGEPFHQSGNIPVRGIQSRSNILYSTHNINEPRGVNVQFINPFAPTATTTSSSSMIGSTSMEHSRSSSSILNMPTSIDNSSPIKMLERANSFPDSSSSISIPAMSNYTPIRFPRGDYHQNQRTYYKIVSCFNNTQENQKENQSEEEVVETVKEKLPSISQILKPEYQIPGICLLPPIDGKDKLPSIRKIERWSSL
ncbi:uncharacterized protein J8A68_005952 [[Candida] subhashii]|uniref:DUF7082 domain-containing protein n=1 Tax=[Candida] subhashii TaxID=561895 RepID=A0A8J5QFL0_9ASCO|nr:uncharacterized protein J8A68_005952 [[Candida] subhashii]KAG7660533.1 hypothetical protein J8A68_005952 [[Candida] subhashii]